MLYPVVTFFQYKCHLRNRILSIIVTMLITLAVLTGLVILVVPPTISEGIRLVNLLADMAREQLGDTSFTDQLNTFARERQIPDPLGKLIGLDSVKEAVPVIFSYVWSLISGTFGFLVGLFGMVVIFLYTIFLLMDYEMIVNGWANMIPHRFRSYAKQLMGDVERNMNAYFRGQCIIALLVGILFSIGL